METKRAYGNRIVGLWRCTKCGFEIFPAPLHKQQDSFKWGTGAEALQKGYVGPFCKECNISLEYDEEE